MAIPWSLGLFLWPLLWLNWPSSTAFTLRIPTCSRLVSFAHDVPHTMACSPCACYRPSDSHVVAHCEGLPHQLERLPRKLPHDTGILCFRGNKLERVDSDVFSAMTSLLELDLSRNEVSDLSPGAFEDLKALQSIDLSNNGIRNVSERVFSGLNELRNLKLSKNVISTLESDAFENSCRLQSIDLSHNALRALKKGTFSGLSSLVNLSLSHNAISYLEAGAFEELVNLSFLDMSCNKLSALSPHAFLGLENLIGLSLQNNSLPLNRTAYPEYVLKPLQRNLRLLLLNGNSEVDCGANMEYPEELSRLMALETLHIDGLCNATFGPNFAELRQLRNLSLSGRTGHCAIGTLLTDAFLYLPHLTYLNLSLCGIHDSEESVFRSLSRLEVLDLSCNYRLGFRNLSKAGRGLSACANLTKLRIDFIHGRYSVSIFVRTEDIEFLTNTSLKHLYASGNRIEAFQQGALSQLPKTLEKIIAKYNRFTYRPYIFELPSLTSLTRLELGNGGIDTDLPRSYRTPSDFSRYCLNGGTELFPGRFHRHGEDEAESASAKSTVGRGRQSELDDDGEAAPNTVGEHRRKAVGLVRSSPLLYRPRHDPDVKDTTRTWTGLAQERTSEGPPGYGTLLGSTGQSSGKSGLPDPRVSSSQVLSPSIAGMRGKPIADESDFKWQLYDGDHGATLPPPRDECDVANGTFKVNLPPNLTKLSMRWSHLYYHVNNVHFNETNQLQFLDLSCNGLSVLQGPVTGLRHLTHLDLATNFAHIISPSFFKCLRGLKFLNLSGNNFDIRIIKNNVFQYLGDLETLDISKNRLDGLSRRALENLTNIRHIDISVNRVTAAFLDINMTKFQKLEALILRANNLNYLSNTLKDSLDEIAKHRKVQVDLSLNPISCSCDSLDFLNWMTKTKVGFINKDQNFCLFPNGTATLMPDVNATRIILARTCHKIPLTFTLTLFGSTVFIIVSIMGAVCYRLRWKLRYAYYAYRNMQARASEEEHSFLYDAFISHAEEDYDFVHNELMHRLETQEGLRACIHYRDFMPGRPIASNILEAVQNSRRTVFIISRDFLQSYWCRYELQMAKMESLHTGREVVVMVLFENIRACSLPTEVLYYVQTDTYVEYPRDPRCVRYFWDNLVRALK